MISRRDIDRLIALLAILVGIAFCIVSYFYTAPNPVTGDNGVCLLDPVNWGLPPFLSWLLAFFVLGGIVAGSYFLNNSYNFIRTPEPILPGVFIIMTASNPWVCRELTGSLLLCGVNILSLAILLRAYKRPKVTPEIFMAASFLSIGSMFQYAFLAMVPAYIGIIAALKVFRLKELLAFFMGLIAPYWIVIGLGIIPVENFHLPEFYGFFSNYTDSVRLLLLIISVGIAGLLGLLLGFSNSLKLYAGNSRVNAINLSISLLGLMSIICIIIDFHNVTAYIATLYFTVAVQIANVPALWQIPHPRIVPWAVMLVYIGFFIGFLSV